MDVALDVFNSELLARGLKEMSNTSQIVAVSHRQHLPLLADRVICVVKPDLRNAWRKLTVIQRDRVESMFAQGGALHSNIQLRFYLFIYTLNHQSVG